jgi:hypothetical protein
MPYLIARPLPPPSMSQGRNHLLCAKLQLFRHQLPQPNICFLSPPQKSSSLHFLSPDLSGRPVFPEPRRGGRHWRIAYSSLFFHLCRERGPGGLGKTTSLENLSVYLFLAKGSVTSSYIFLASVFAVLESFIPWFCMGPCTCRGSDITCLTATPINHPSCVHSP